MEFRVNNDELMHYGVMGMKWGVRNAETRAKYSGKKNNSQKLSRKEYKEMKRIKKKSIRETEKSRQKRQDELDEMESLAKAKRDEYVENRNRSNPNSRIDSYNTEKGRKLGSDYERKADASWQYSRETYKLGQQKADNIIKKQYGKEKYDQYVKKQNKANGVAATAAVVGTLAIMAAPVALPVVAWKLK